MALTKTQKLRDRFVEDTQQICTIYNSLSQHATETENSVLAEQAVVSLTVALESFISELLVILICERPNEYLLTLSQEMKTALLNSGHSHPRVKYLVSEGAARLSIEELREVILNDGDNIAFSETSTLKGFISKNLTKDLAFEISDNDSVFIDLLKGIRNLCAHHSQKAARNINGKFKNHFHDVKTKDLLVCRALVQEGDINSQNVGAYLKKHAPGQAKKTRVEFVAGYLRDMAFRWIK